MDRLHDFATDIRLTLACVSLVIVIASPTDSAVITAALLKQPNGVAALLRPENDVSPVLAHEEAMPNEEQLSQE